MTTHENHRGPRFSWEINAGHVLHAAVLVVSVIVWAFAQSGQIRDAQNDIKHAQKDIASLQMSMNGQFDALNKKIEELPDMRAEVTQIEHHSGQVDARLDALDNRMGKVERDGVGLRSDLDNLIRASDQPLPRGKGR